MACRLVPVAAAPAADGTPATVAVTSPMVASHTWNRWPCLVFAMIAPSSPAANRAAADARAPAARRRQDAADHTRVVATEIDGASPGCATSGAVDRPNDIGMRG